MSNSTIPMPVRVLLVDDHAIVRVGLRNLIDDEPDLHVIGEGANCAEALRLAGALQPHVIVLDLRLPDGSGVDHINALKNAAPKARVLVLTSYADDALLLSALKSGADGYLLKDVAEADLVESIRKVASATMVIPQVPSMNAWASTEPPGTLPKSPFEELTGQERRVFELVGRGHSNRETAEITGLTEKTVRNYLSRVFDKLGLRRRSQLVALYMARQPWKK